MAMLRSQEEGEATHWLPNNRLIPVTRNFIVSNYNLTPYCKLADSVHRRDGSGDFFWKMGTKTVRLSSLREDFTQAPGSSYFRLCKADVVFLFE